MVLLFQAYFIYFLILSLRDIICLFYCSFVFAFIRQGLIQPMLTSNFYLLSAKNYKGIPPCLASAFILDGFILFDNILLAYIYFVIVINSKSLNPPP